MKNRKLEWIVGALFVLGIGLSVKVCQISKEVEKAGKMQVTKEALIAGMKKDPALLKALRGPQGPQGEPGENRIDPDKVTFDWNDIARGIKKSPKIRALLRGKPGLQGETGIQGEKGDPGERGPRGRRGPKGEVGSAGPQGEPGPAGLPGSRGKRGLRGKPGSGGMATECPPGPRGPAGPSGLQGPAGPAGPQGECVSSDGKVSVGRGRVSGDSEVELRRDGKIIMRTGGRFQNGKKKKP